MNQSTRSTPRLSPLDGKPILLGFDGADMSSDAGLTLLREIERKAGLAQRLADCLAAVAGLRWTIEECFLRAKDDLGLDHCEARSWHGWHRHMSLVMAAAAFLASLSAEQRRTAFSKPNKTSPRAQPEAA